MDSLGSCWLGKNTGLTQVVLYPHFSTVKIYRGDPISGKCSVLIKDLLIDDLPDM